MTNEEFIEEALKIVRLVAQDINSEAKARLASIVLLKKWEKRDEA